MEGKTRWKKRRGEDEEEKKRGRRCLNCGSPKGEREREVRLGRLS